jgi:hypothetical protein
MNILLIKKRVLQVGKINGPEEMKIKIIEILIIIVDKIKQKQRRLVHTRARTHTHTHKNINPTPNLTPGGRGSQSRGKVLGLKTNGKLATHLRSCRV